MRSALPPNDPAVSGFVTAPALLGATNLACRRGGRLVFGGLGFTLAPGGALVITGPNGSGKSTLLRLLAGLGRPVAGTVTWDGEPVGDDPAARASLVAYAGHQDAVKPGLDVMANLAGWARLARPGQSARDRARDALDRFDLSRLASLPARVLSQGQRRRLALSRLPVLGRPLWLLDEPSAGLDTASVGRLRAVIADHRAQGGMVIASTHVDLGLEGAGALDVAAFTAPIGFDTEPEWAG